MALLLYINGQLLDLDSTQVIAQTKQVNDLNSLENRQAGYTNKFKVPKTGGNIKAMDFLTVTGNSSSLPYQKNECSLYSEGGECFVYKGRAVVTDGGDSYEVVIYDGIIDLYKAIENKSLSELGLSELDHQKTVYTIKASWDNELNYRYIMADYNGGTGLVNFPPLRIVNADYLVPAVRVSYIWNKIFSHFGFDLPQGSVFNTQNFKNLWMTFPKGTSSPDNEAEIFNATATSIQSNYGHYYAVFDNLITEDVISSGGLLTIKQPGTYRVTVTGRASALYNANNQDIIIAKNAGGIPAGSIVPYRYIVNNMGDDALTIDYAFIDNFTAYDNLCIIADNLVSWQELPLVTITRIDNAIDFSTALADFSIRDFLTEVVHRFGLTLFKDKYKNSYTFLTLQEHLQTPDVIDLSVKFVKKISENYIHGSYAQRNWLRYAYNDKEATHNDASIDISNVNLADTKDAIKSKIYSPELKEAKFFNKPCKVYPLWEKEVTKEENEEGEEETIITYNPLDKRYYFLRCSEDTVSNASLYSPQQQETLAFSHHYRESYSRLPFRDIVQDYYGPVSSVLNNALIVTADIYFKDHDIASFDFKKLYYIEQLSAYFIMNKINNYVPGKITRCELVRVAYTNTNPQPSLKIIRIVINGNDVTVYFMMNRAPQNLLMQISTAGGGWQNASGGGNSPVSGYVPSGTHTLRLFDSGGISNTVQITVPGNQEINL